MFGQKKFCFFVKNCDLYLLGTFLDHFVDHFGPFNFTRVFFSVLKWANFSHQKVPKRQSPQKELDFSKIFFQNTLEPSLQFLCFNFWKRFVIFHFFVFWENFGVFWPIFCFLREQWRNRCKIVYSFHQNPNKKKLSFFLSQNNSPKSFKFKTGLETLCIDPK